MNCPPRHRFIFSHFRVIAKVTLSVKEMANILANYNQYNRPRTAPWEEYKKDIDSGLFRYDVGNSVQFDIHGHVIDGSHRLYAHWYANKPFTTVVFVGLPEDAILYKDGNAPRKSCVNPVLYASIRRGVPATPEDFKLKQLQLSLSRLMLKVESDWKGSSPNSLRQERYFQSNKNAVSIGMKGAFLGHLRQDQRWTRRPGARAAIALYAKRFPTHAKKFLTLLYGDGNEILSGSPVDLLRKELISPSMSGGSQMYNELKYTLEVIQAYHQGQRYMKKLVPRYRLDF
jgi:hypothetical protein